MEITIPVYFSTSMAAPKIEEMRVAKNFYWCIYYKVTGFPKPQRAWYFNNILLQNPLIQDLENAWTMKNTFLADETVTAFERKKDSGYLLLCCGDPEQHCATCRHNAGRGLSINPVYES
ncbi:ig-like domain-containing protein [Trichonephila clavata]|uniref:Ig-like domain-containing protein n=1 Tax=Trichonephila clavata TaxID=2740835 RepID=A0A8X6I9V4_TRICU|nr:ig-like domain-containing protein [Trichonephila clavata]